jgi:hypothetical protein
MTCNTCGGWGDYPVAGPYPEHTITHEPCPECAMTFNVTMRFWVRYADRRYHPDSPPADDIFDWGECVSESECRAIFLASHPHAYIVREQVIERSE